MTRTTRKTAIGMGIVIALSGGFVLAASPDDETAPGAAADLSTQSAEMMPRASKSLVLDIADASDRAIAVGERGHVLVSESRSDWRQVEGVPTRSTLTGVATIGNLAWAVGHDGVILHSRDGGLSWMRQRAAPFDPGSDDPRNGAPLLDVFFLDAEHGYALGAYALLLRTDDGGATWGEVALPGGSASAEIDAEDGLDEDDSWIFDEEDTEILEEADPHLNAITRLEDGTLFIVAERGAAFRSRGGDAPWERLTLPYDGSMFGVLALGPRHLLAYGLRGNVQESTDGGDTWQVLDTGTTLSLFGGTMLPGGGVVLVGANGIVLHRRAGSATFEMTTYENANLETPVLSTVQARDGSLLLLAGEKGLDRFQVP